MRRRFVQILGYLVIAGLVVVLAGVAGFGPLSGLKQDDAPTSASEGETTPTTAGTFETRSYAIGDCVTWDRTDRGSGRRTTVVPCAEQHLFEVVSKERMDFDRYPSDAEISAFSETTCGPAVERFIDGKLDPHGRYQPLSLHPAPNGWDAGDRTAWCGVAVVGTIRPPVRGEDEYSKGSVVGARQERVQPVGSCWKYEAAYSMPCSQEHNYEVTGSAVVAGSAPPPPTKDVQAWRSILIDRCLAATREYLGGEIPADVGTGWLSIRRESWDAGRRTAECLAYRTRDGADVPMTGSLKG